MSESLIAELIQAGTPPALVAKVAMALGRAEADQAAITARREADRARKEKQRHVTSQEVTGSHVTAESHVTSRDQQDAPAPAHPLTNSSSSQELLPKEPPLRGVPKGKVQPARRCRIASDAQPTDRDRSTAERSGMDAPTFRHEWAKFRDHHVSVGSLMADWPAAWSKWTLGWVDRRPPPMNGHARAGPLGKPSVTSVVNELHEELGFGRH